MKVLKYFFIFSLFCSAFSYAQRPAMKVGGNSTTINPAVALEVESTTQGFLPPRMTNAQISAIVTPAQGLIVYCTDCNPVGLRINDGTSALPNWQSLEGGGGISSASVVANCNTSGFTSGLFLSNTPVSGLSYSVTITNNSFSSVVITFAASDLVLSGLSNLGTLSVGTPTGGANFSNGQANLTSGQSVTVTYPISGTPASCGTLTGIWTKLNLSCTKTLEIFPNIDCSGGSWTTAVSPAPTAGLVAGTAYTGTYTIPLSGGACNYPAESYTINGLTFAYAGGTVGASGNLTYNLSGTYSGTTGETVLFTTRRGCTSGICANQGFLPSQDLDCDGIINADDHDDDNDGILDFNEQGGVGASSTLSLSGVTGTLNGAAYNFASSTSLGTASISNQVFITATFPTSVILTSLTFTQTNQHYLVPGSSLRIEGSTNGTTWNELKTFGWPAIAFGVNFSVGDFQNIGSYRFYRIFAIGITGAGGGVLTGIIFNGANLKTSAPYSLDPDPNSSSYVMSGSWPGLNFPQLTSGFAWGGTDNTSTNQFVGMRFPASKIDGVVLRGRADAAQWVTSFQLQATKDGTNWVSLGTFAGNTDQNTSVVRTVSNNDRDWIGLRINPLTWSGHPCLRFQFSLTETATDRDNDGIANHLDMDSDNDGCLDALEGSLRFKQPSLAGNRLAGTINAFGVPSVAGATGQGILDSQNPIVNACSRVDWTTATLSGITSTGTATLISPTSIKVVMNYTSDALQTVTVPSGATSVQVKAWGAGGGKGGDDWGVGGNGGGGAYSTNTVAVSGGNVLQVFVANNGNNGIQSRGGGGGSGGWGFCNGGAGGNAGPNIGASGAGGGGGGSSAVLNSTLNSLIAVAGGGGGAGGGGSNSNGGGGGGGGVSSGNSVCQGATGGSHSNDGGGGGGGGGGHTSGGVGGGVAGGDFGGGGGGGGNNFGTATNGNGTTPGNAGDADRCATCGNGNGGKGLVVIYFTQP